MAFLADPEFLVRGLGIIVINLILSGDNAVVIAMAVRTLPPRQRLFGQIGGTIGAVVLRLAFVAIIAQLLRIPFVEAAGGLVLVWIALKLVRQEGGEGEGEGKVRHGTTFWEAIWIIIVADLIMSLDNVLAIAAAARGDLILVIFGIGLSIPIVIWGSGLLAGFMNRYQWIVWIGGGLLGWVAGEMMVKDRIVVGWIEPWKEVLRWVVPAALGLALTGLGWWLARRARAVESPPLGTSGATD